MEKLAARLADYISKSMNYDKDKQEVIAYGLIALFQFIVILASISVIGVLAGSWYEAMIVFLAAGLLKKSTGGAHAQTLLGCTVISIILISAFSAVCRYLLMGTMNLFVILPVYLILIICCLFVAYRKVPVDNPNKPITRPEKIKRLRKQSFITITIYGVICIAFAFLSRYNLRFSSLSYAFLLALLWQTFTLTKWGAMTINALEFSRSKRR